MHKAKKQFGQNFLVDQNIIADIVRCIRPMPDDNMVEIGPGLGALTRPLLKQLNKLHVVEIDRDIIARLKTDYPQDKIVIHEGDALKFDFATLGAPLRIVGNLPYNISSPLLFHFANYAEGIIDMHFMLQNEVVERMVAEPSTAAFGRLSVMLQYRFYMEKLLDVPPQSFRPAPKVDSAIVRMIPLPAAQIAVQDEALYAKVVTAAFGQRRKTLRNTLKAHLTESDFAQLDIDPQLRAENLAVTEFTRIANFLHGRADTAS
ncbi:MAG: 16S rRNA (adenine(1518)-N(6)/adenine(1519)-N(6))-dimethyltransferase RsmA [Gammaproteobacteria bacterium]|nr:16S rRNA (adenine(1518)-N(6)/adenine(1519)-N(6))-dimethyltransferase RsmA [Gammaproteobacteria bacterium]MBU1448057.1 16S rRNA (adenine(1518)-N(6)/adenine(1519)-N(6))-dimethyltransferase RsmA [Gammaproteobacteria bacterium]MDD2929592.1 16S rRNA (adenine(1518)-N(6)/adenine(1519)-N(6))-dimethyltransferase RsmA [Sideroxydans sp.]MDD5471122.1 16S rRNA (adenine(1518)-N(6)/adenine(1519)-N(6))-dimethyltransferase RsmA [Sideroxydans sp.]